jgi:hypothetical protein
VVISLVFEPDPALGSDPLDPASMPRRLGEVFDTATGIDAFLVVREYGERFQGGSRTHVWSSGAWENVQSKAIKKILGKLGAL